MREGLRLYFRRTRILPYYLAPVFFLEAGRVVGFFSYPLLSWSCAGAGGLRCRTRPPQKFFESVEGMKPLTVAIASNPRRDRVAVFRNPLVVESVRSFDYPTREENIL